MALKTIAHKVLRAEKRILDADRPSRSSMLSLSSFWIVAASGSLVFAAFSFYNADWDRKHDVATLGVDPITTSSSVPADLNRNQFNRLSQTDKRLIEEQNQRIDNLTSVLKRVREEQAIMARTLVRLTSKDRPEAANTSRSEQTEPLENGEAPSSIETSNGNTKQTSANSPQLQSGTGTTARDTKQRSQSSEKKVASQKQATSDKKVDDIIPRKVRISRVESPRPVELTRSPRPPATDNDQKTSRPEISTSRFAKSPKAETATSEKTGVTIDPVTVSAIPPVTGSNTKQLQVNEARFAIDLGVNPTQERASDLWRTLTQKNPSLLSPLEPRYVSTQRDEGETRLLAGPYFNAADAIRTCVALRRDKAFCKTTLFPN